jgi:sugar phosphate isomerase/epimerase
MKLGVVSTALGELPFADGLAYAQSLGLSAIEVTCAGWQENLEYGDPVELASDSTARHRWLDAFKRAGLEISALSIHGQPLSPDPEIARKYDHQFRAACQLAEQVGVERLTLLAGLPEGCPGDQTPCWVVNAFPPQNHDIYRWQWEERCIPYWIEHGRVASDHGCRLCFEMHPCDIVYHPSALLKLREAVGPVVGCNFDPSHLFWQGIDSLAAMRHLGPAIYHVHAKDTVIDRAVADLDGVLDPKPFSQIGERAWTFRTVGYGHDTAFWREFVSTLRVIGYDDVLSIEHEDEYLDLREGLEKAVTFLRPLIFDRPRGPAVWEFMQAASQGSQDREDGPDDA